MYPLGHEPLDVESQNPGDLYLALAKYLGEVLDFIESVPPR